LFFLNLKAGGVPLDNISRFVDRGKQMHGQRRLKLFGENWLHLKKCTYDLAKNVCGKFAVGILKLKRLIYQLQSCESIYQYIVSLIDICKTYCVIPKNATKIEEVVDGSIMLYLFSINPIFFSIVGNLNISEVEIDLMNFVWGNDSSGDRKPLFGINSTNGIEGENNAYLHNNICHEIVLNGAIAFMSRCTLVRTKLLEKYKNYISTNATVTQKALEYINKERQAMNNHIVAQIDPSQDIYNVVKAGRTHIVDINDKTCSRCLI
jgi:hypothetical protein